MTTLVGLAVEAVQEGRGPALAAGVGGAQEAYGVAADVDQDLHRDLHVVAAEKLPTTRLFDANAGPPMMAIAAAEVASTPATRVLICTYCSCHR